MIDRALLLSVRRALIMLLCALDDALGLPRTIPSKQDRRQVRRDCVDISGETVI